MKNTLNQIWIDGDPAYFHLAGLRNNILVCRDAGWDYKLHTNVQYKLPVDLWGYCVPIDQNKINEIKVLPCCSTRRSVNLPHVVDLLRYNILSVNGGMYLDADDYLFVSPEELLKYHKSGTILALDQSARKSKIRLTNSVLYAESGLPFCEMYNRASNLTSYQWGSTGPAFMEAMYNEDPEQFSVLPSEITRYSGSAAVWEGQIHVKDKTSTELIFSPNGSWCHGTNVELVYNYNDLLPLGHPDRV